MAMDCLCRTETFSRFWFLYAVRLTLSQVRTSRLDRFTYLRL
jgi:hypothetical protein